MDNSVYDNNFYPDAAWIPALNTSVSPDPEADAVPFNHLQRLADKVAGAAELALDNVTADQRRIAAMNERTIREISSPPGLLPPTASAWISRNVGVITSLLVIAFAVYIGAAFIRR